jgi:hypothetical protein
MKNTLKLAVVAMGFAAFTTSCNKTEKAAEKTGETGEATTDSVATKMDEAVTSHEGDTAVVVEKEADAAIERDPAEAEAAKHEAH